MNRLSRLFTLSLAVVLLLSAFLLSGCGKTDDPQTDSPTSAATTRAEPASVGNADAAVPRKMVDRLLNEWNGLLTAQYGAALPDTYAGAYNDTTALVICVTDESAAEAYRALLTDEVIRDTERQWLTDTGAAAEKWAEYTWVHYATVAYSLNELQAVKDKLSKNAAEWKIADMTIDVANNRLTVELDGKDEAKATVLSALNEREVGMVRILFHLPA